jgi:hypothetical protein
MDEESDKGGCSNTLRSSPNSSGSVQEEPASIIPLQHEYWRGVAAVTYNLHALVSRPSSNPNGEVGGKVKTVFRIIES